MAFLAIFALVVSAFVSIDKADGAIVPESSPIAPMGAPILRNDAEEEGQVTSYFALEWIRSMDNQGYVAEDRNKVLTGFSSYAEYKAVIDINPKGNGKYNPGEVQIRIPTKGLVARDGTRTGAVLTSLIPAKGSDAVTSNSPYVFYYEGDDNEILVIENNAPLNREAHLRIPINYRLAQYEQANGSVAHKAFADYKDGSRAEFQITITTPEGEDKSNIISAELNTAARVLMSSYGASSGNMKKEDLETKLAEQGGDWVWGVSPAFAYQQYSSTQNATFDKLTFTFTEDTLDNYPHIRFDTMPVDTAKYDVVFSSNKQEVTVTCKDAATCTWIGGNLAFKVVLPGSDFDTTPETGTLTPQYKVTTNATPVDGADPVIPLAQTQTLTLQWYTPAPPTPTPTPEETDNSYTALVEQNGEKRSPEKVNAENGEEQRPFELNALWGGQNQYQSYTIGSNFDGNKATTRLAGAIPTTTMAASKTGNLVAGDDVTYTVTLKNDKTYDSRRIAFEIPFPDGIEIDPAALTFTVNGADYTMPAANLAWDSDNRILTVKDVPNISPGKTFAATIPAHATKAVRAGFGMLELDQTAIENQNCGTTTECYMTVRNTGSAATPAGVPFEMSFVSPKGRKFKNNEFTSIKVNGRDVDIRTQFNRGQNAVAYLPALNPGDEITFTFNSDAGQTEEPSMVRGKFGTLTLLAADKIAPATSSPYVMVGALRKDVADNYQKRPFVFETIDAGLNFMQGSLADTCVDTYGTAGNGQYYNCHLDNQDSQINTVRMGYNKPEYVDTTTHPEAIVTLYGTPNYVTPTWTKYAVLHFTYHTGRPAETNSSGSGAGYYLTSVDYFNGAQLGASGEKHDIKLPAGVFAVRVVEEGHLRALNWQVKTVLFADGPRVKARVNKLFTDNPYPSYQVVYNDMFQFTYDPADKPADGSIPSADKLMQRQNLSVNELPPFMRTDPTVREDGPVGASNSLHATASVRLNVEPQRTTNYSHSFRDDAPSASINGDGTMFTIANSLAANSDIAYGYGANCVFKEKTESGEWKRMTGVRYYSLQPLGVRVKKDTVRADERPEYAGMEILDVTIVENWRGSGRQMLIVTVKNTMKTVEPATCERGVDVGIQSNSNLELSRINWEADYTNVSYFTYGKTLTRLDAMEAITDDDALYRYYEPKTSASDQDRGVSLEGTNTAPIGWFAPNRELMDMLGGAGSEKTYVYGFRNLDLPQNPTVASDFKKYVAVSGGSYALKAWINPGEEYSYQLPYANVSRTSQKNIVFYDSLENETENGDGTSNTNPFHGTMTGLSLNTLKMSGIAPKVYYSTKQNAVVNSETSGDVDLSDTNVWTLIPDAQLETFDWSQATAFAVDCSTMANGNEFLLPRDAWLSLEVFMKAPEDAEAKQLLSAQKPSAWAYNRAYAHVLVPDETLASGAPKEGTTWSKSVKPSTTSQLALHRSVMYPRALKSLSGHALAQDQFSFEMKKAGSDEVIATGTNMAANLVSGSANGLVGFGSVEVTSSDIGEVTYQFTEVNDGKLGYTYDEAVKTAIVQVVDAGDGQVTILGDDNWPTFNNAYNASGTITVQGLKEVRGTLGGPSAPALYEGQFQFGLYDASGTQVATATNKADGSITFADISVDETNIGSRTYTVKEIGECPFEWECDTDTESVSVTITDNDDGTLTTAVNGTATFTNVYTPVPATGLSYGTVGGNIFLIVSALLGGIVAFHIRRRYLYYRRYA